MVLPGESGQGVIRCVNGITYVAGVVAIAITLTVVVRHDGERWIVKTVSPKVCSIRVFKLFL
jgi:hypothetical protein